MNPITYQVKRAHWRATWKAIEDFKLQATLRARPTLKLITPARFDILWAVWKVDARFHERRRELGLPKLDHRISMGKLKELLGLAGPTVSRTAHRMEDLELLKIVPDERDRRCVNVVLTKLGLRMVRLALDCIVTPESGMRHRIESYVFLHAFDGLSKEGSAEDVRQRLLVRQEVILDRWHRYAWYFGCGAVSIYDTRYWVG